MTEVFATLIVPASEVVEARSIASQFSGGEGMFTTGLSESGDEPATHYISSGIVSVDIITALASISFVADLPPFEVLEQHSLKLC